MAIPAVVPRFGRYFIQRPIGSEGACDLWQVESANSDGTLRRSILYQLKGQHAAELQLAEVFIANGRRAMRLRHPNIARIEDVLIDRSGVGVVAEFVDGTSVSSLVGQIRKCENSIPIWFALHVTRAICEAMLHAHARQDDAGYADPSYHQALGSEQVIIAGTGLVKVTGFGLGVALSEPAAAAPVIGPSSESGEHLLEHLPSSQSSVWTDIASVGRVLYELLTSVALSSNVVDSPLSFVPPSHLAPWVTRGVDELLRRALDASSADCFACMSQLADAIDEYQAHGHQPVQGEHIAALVQVLAQSAKREDTPPGKTGSPLPLGRLKLIQTAHPRPAARAARSRSKHGAGQRVDHEPTPTRAESMSMEPPPSSDNAHDWEAAVTGSRRNTCGADSTNAERSEPELVWELTPEDEPARAIAAFEEGLERLRSGDMLGAELAWTRTLDFDPKHRAAIANLKLLKKRRELRTH